MRPFVLPAIIVLFALISLSILMSIAPNQAVRQLIFFVLGLAGFAVISRFPFETILRFSPLMYIGLNLLLVFTLLFATITRGTARWISFGDAFVLQPSQMAIPITSLFLIYFLRKHSIRKLSVFIQSLVIIAIPAVLILVAPDLDTTIVFLASLATIIWFSNTQTKHLVAVSGLAVLIAIGAWFFVLKEYQKERFTSFFEGKTVEGTAHYNAEQALIAIGSGQVVGKGLGLGVQSHLRFLPERQTDFIFASLAEEYGFIGSATVVALYLLITIFCIYIGYTTKNPEEKLFAFVVGAALFFQSIVNMSMNLGLIPIAGLTLPLLSYGGSSVLAVCAMLGVMQTIAQKSRNKFTLHLS